MGTERSWSPAGTPELPSRPTQENVCLCAQPFWPQSSELPQEPHSAVPAGRSVLGGLFLAPGRPDVAPPSEEKDERRCHVSSVQDGPQGQV